MEDYSWENRLNEWLAKLPKEKFDKYKAMADELERTLSDEIIDGCPKYQRIIQRLVVTKLTEE